MNKIYLKAFAIVLSVAITITVIFYFTGNHPKPMKRDHSRTQLDDEEYLIYPSDSTDKWNIIFPSGEKHVNLKPEQIALFLKSGEINSDTTWVIYPQCKYQLTMDDEHIIVEDFGRPVAKLFYSQTGKLADILIKDNE